MSLLEALGNKQAPSRQFYDEESESSEIDFSKPNTSFQPTKLFDWQWHPLTLHSTSDFISKPLFIGEDIFSKVMLTFLKTSQAKKIATCTLEFEKPLGSTNVCIDFYYLNDCVWFTLPFSPPSIPFELYTPLYLTLHYHLSPSQCIGLTCLSTSPCISSPSIAYLSNNLFDPLIKNNQSSLSNPLKLPFSSFNVNPFQEPYLFSNFSSTFLVHHPRQKPCFPNSNSNSNSNTKTSIIPWIPCLMLIVRVSRKLGYPDLDPSLDSKWKSIFHSFSFLNQDTQVHWLNALKFVRHQLEIESPLYV